MSLRSSPSKIMRRSSLLGLGAGLVASMLPPGSRAAVGSEVVVGKGGWLFSIFDQIDRVDLARIRQTSGLINEAVALLKRADIQVAISLTPAKSRVYWDCLPNGTRFSAVAQQRYATILGELRRPGTVVPDLATTLLDLRRTRPNDPLFFKADTHWTPGGAEPAAAAVAEQIRGRLSLPPSGKPGTRLRTPVTVVKGENDLANLLPPADRPKYPLESYQLRQIGDEGQGNTLGGLLGEEGADTVLVGNSYMHPRFGFEPMLSNQLDRPVWLVWKVHQFSPFWNLISYLKSPAFSQRRPKLIVWNFHEADLGIAPESVAIWAQSAMVPQAILTEMRRTLAA